MLECSGEFLFPSGGVAEQNGVLRHGTQDIVRNPDILSALEKAQLFGLNSIKAPRHREAGVIGKLKTTGGGNDRLQIRP
jgi:hypothetical protein